jgi:hypothetical protein
MAEQVDLKDVDVYYGDFLAVEGVTSTTRCARSTGCTRGARVGVRS